MPRRPPPRQRRLLSSRWALALVVAALAAGAMLCIGTGWAFWVWFHRPDIVARVLFCETANCTPQERLLVAGMMHNRIGQAVFGNPASLRAVVEQPGAFSCIGDNGNSNWVRTRHPARLTAAEQAIWRECLALARGRIPAAVGPSGRPLVYYHDRSISKPRSWDNQQWRAVPELFTVHFIFYSIVRVRG